MSEIFCLIKSCVCKSIAAQSIYKITAQKFREKKSGDNYKTDIEYEKENGKLYYFR